METHCKLLIIPPALRQREKQAENYLMHILQWRFMKAKLSDNLIAKNLSAAEDLKGEILGTPLASHDRQKESSR